MRIDFAAPKHRNLAAATLVLQSHRQPRPLALIDDCLASVERWAEIRGYQYQYIGDELFDLLPMQLRRRLRDRLVVASDVARLLLLQQALAAGYNRVVWFDADIYVVDPAALVLPDCGFAVGRETWVQNRDGRARLFKKVHNAVLQSVQHDPVLPFYLQTAQRLLEANPQRFPDQFVGPKLLTAWHNIAPFDVVEQVNMLPPSVAKDIAGGWGASAPQSSAPSATRAAGPYLTRYCQALPVAPAALNLCASAVLANEISESQLECALWKIKDNPELLRVVT